MTIHKVRERKITNQYNNKGLGEENREPKVKYMKRKGTSGVSGHLFESKLLSLVLLRCLTDNEVEDFLLGSNVDGVGDLDDICLRFTYKNKPVAAFIQSKHKDDASKGMADSSLYSPKSKVNLLKCFDSYLQVLNKFEIDDSHIFNGIFKDLTFHFIVYTSAVNKISKKKIKHIEENNDTFVKVRQIISCKDHDPNSKDIFQIEYDNHDVNLLANVLIDKEIDLIAKYFVNIIDKQGKNKYENFKKYANILVPDVITLTENDDYYDASVNPNVFHTTDEILIKLKYRIYEEILSKSQVDSDYLVQNLQSLIHCEDGVADVICLGKLIYRYIVFDERSNKLTFNDKVKESVINSLSKYSVRERLERLQVSKVLVYKATEKAGKELLESVKFKIPKHEIDFDEIKQCKDIKSLFNNEINIAKNFMSTLYFYTNQGQEKDVAKRVTEEIAQYYKQSKNSAYKLTTQSDVPFLKFHDKIQKWWLLDSKSYFLTKTCDFLEKLASEIGEPFKYQNEDYPTLKTQFHISFLFIATIWLIGNIVDAYKSSIVLISNECFGELNGHCISLVDENVTLSDVDDEIRNWILEYKVDFQGHKIKINDLLINDHYTIIKAGMINKILKNETISIGRKLSNSRYEDIKEVYVPRTFTYRTKSEDTENKNTATEYTLNTFKDTPAKNTNIITGEAGMGKSTVLTHLSIETKNKYPRAWIARMNLLDYTDEFEKLGAEVNPTKFMKLILKSEFEDISNFSIADVGGNIFVEYTGNDDVLAFSLSLMMNCYSKGKIIFIFDGFDEICPDYMTPVSNFINNFVNIKHDIDSSKCSERINGNQIWITSRPYNTIVRHLENQFGAILNLEPLASREQHIFFEKYWNFNFQIQEITIEQFNNINIFYEFMSQFGENATDLFTVPIADYPLYKMYATAVKYFRNEIPNMPTNIAKNDIVDKWISYSDLFQTYRGMQQRMKKQISDTEQIIGVPLYMDMAASYFVNEIKTNDNKLAKEWNFSYTTYYYYKAFIQLQFKVRFEEKNGMKLSKPDVKSIYIKEQQKFMRMHKKLAFYAMFHTSEYYETLLTISDRLDIANTIQEFVDGKEKTGLIQSIHNNVPRFIHISFAKYLAVEFISDLIDKQRIPLPNFDQHSKINVQNLH